MDACLVGRWTFYARPEWLICHASAGAAWFALGHPASLRPLGRGRPGAGRSAAAGQQRTHRPDPSLSGPNPAAWAKAAALANSRPMLNGSCVSLPKLTASPATALRPPPGEQAGIERQPAAGVDLQDAAAACQCMQRRGQRLRGQEGLPGMLAAGALPPGSPASGTVRIVVGAKPSSVLCCVAYRAWPPVIGQHDGRVAPAGWLAEGARNEAGNGPDLDHALREPAAAGGVLACCAGAGGRPARR